MLTSTHKPVLARAPSSFNKITYKRCYNDVMLVAVRRPDLRIRLRLRVRESAKPLQPTQRTQGYVCVLRLRLRRDC